MFTLANQITADEADGHRQCEKLVEMLLAFAEKNPGMVRVMTGDALVGEHERLQARMNQFFERFESTMKQSLRVASDGDAAGRAGALLRYVLGCLHQYAKSGFAKKPTESFTRSGAICSPKGLVPRTGPRPLFEHTPQEGSFLPARCAIQRSWRR